MQEKTDGLLRHLGSTRTGQRSRMVHWRSSRQGFFDAASTCDTKKSPLMRVFFRRLWARCRALSRLQAWSLQRKKLRQQLFEVKTYHSRSRPADSVKEPCERWTNTPGRHTQRFGGVQQVAGVSFSKGYWFSGAGLGKM